MPWHVDGVAYGTAGVLAVLPIAPSGRYKHFNLKFEMFETDLIF